ncbi:TldD/PmbA family protein [Bacillus sp. B-jedd]|uniref:TldD/PmbA family protein n=1 Tax=Bacillus sp. B-jedd TaxID=1476857 RepID=UPI0005156278|nr:TldD/PmbA family protein [Bacillus sp. B-jedd]CEG29388.1 suppressor of the inhibitory activity of the cabon storage regulator (CsrA) [Bacillus sp. B-jedd]
MLQQSIAENVLYAALETGGDFADLFVEDKRNTSLTMTGGVVEKALSGRDFGVGIRILKGDYSVYAFTNDTSEENLIRVARSAAKSIRSETLNLSIDLRKSAADNKHQFSVLPNSVEKSKKVEWMKRAHAAAREFDPIITQTSVFYVDTVQDVLIANSEGLFIEDRRFYNRLGVSAMAEKNGEKESAFMGPGSFAGLEYMDNLNIEAIGREAAQSAKTILFADYAPSGNFPVVINNGFGGVIFHEACGHGLESVAVSRKASVFADKVGESVASPLVTAYDDGTILNTWGSLNIDDEGMPTKKNLLIENGILKGYLIDRVGSRKMEMASTGSGRRQNYKYAPTSRMNNTYIAAGSSTPEEIIAATELGIYAKHFEGGSVNPATSDYNFTVSEAYMIRNGKVAEPIKGAALIGKGIDTLKKIDMVGNDLDLGLGMCGASSGSVPVTVGQPTIRVSELTVGGRGGNA